MTTLNSRDLELAMKHGLLYEGRYSVAWSLAEIASFLAERDAEPLTTSYVQTVPDKCDRIVWRNHYYHLPLEQQPNAEAVGEVSMGYWSIVGEEYLYNFFSSKKIEPGTKLFTHAPSQVITRERLVHHLTEAWVEKKPINEVADAILAELNQAQETKL